jgi:dodecin
VLKFEVVILHRLQCTVMTHHIAKIIEVVGASEKGWTEAAQAALDEAKKTITGITGLEVVDKTAKVDAAIGKITEYRVGVKIAFGVEH